MSSRSPRSTTASSRFAASPASPASAPRWPSPPTTTASTPWALIVPDDQLSLAIGKEGQNARLAARLTGLHIDIKNESLAAGILRDLPRATVEEEVVEEGEHRCEYVGANGIQCRNMARPGSRFCGVHEQMAEAEVSDDPLI